MNKRQIQKQLAALKTIMASEQWEVFREAVERELRFRFLAALGSEDPSKREEHLIGARTLLGFLRQFELQGLELEEWLTLKKLVEDEARVTDAAADLRSARGIPRPWNDEERR